MLSVVLPVQLILYQWNGLVSSFGVLQFLHSSVQSWNDVPTYFERMVFDPDDVGLKIISQVRGQTANDIPIDPTTRYVIDGGTQCSTSGLELFVVTPHRHYKNIGSSME